MKPGTSPRILQKKMKRPIVPTRGKYFFPSSPTMSTSRPSKNWMTSSRTLWNFDGMSLSFRDEDEENHHHQTHNDMVRDEMIRIFDFDSNQG